MKVRVAETAGFCFGVKRAVDKVYEQAEKVERSSSDHMECHGKYRKG